MELSSVKDWVEILQGALTTLAIVFAGLWALYVFFLGRSTTASVRIEFELKQLLGLEKGGQIAVITAKFTNVGRTHVRKDICRFGIWPLTSTRLRSDLSHLRPVDSSPDILYQQVWEILEGLTALEPNEEVTQDVAFAWNTSHIFPSEPHMFGLVLSFEGRWLLGLRKKRWAVYGVLPIQTT